jgi:hypothetical protein
MVSDQGSLRGIMSKGTREEMARAFGRARKSQRGRAERSFKCADFNSLDNQREANVWGFRLAARLQLPLPDDPAILAKRSVKVAALAHS